MTHLSRSPRTACGPVPPRGYDYDVCGDEVLITRTRVENGRIVFAQWYELPLARPCGRPLHDARGCSPLAKSGRVRSNGARSDQAGSLSRCRKARKRMKSFAASLTHCGAPGRFTTLGEKITGRGRVLWGYSPARSAGPLWCQRGFLRSKVMLPTDPSFFAHRSLPEREIYFVANHSAKGVKRLARFRVAGLVPALWDPETGDPSTTAEEWRDVNGLAELPLTLEANQSVFVVFQRAAEAKNKPEEGPFCLGEGHAGARHLGRPLGRSHFTPGWGAPEQIQLPQLKSWTEHEDLGVRHYSGSAVYACDFCV